jgi:hypothetical protein
MKKFILFYKGPATPPDASHAEWPAWFNKLGDKLVSVGSPMEHGVVLHSNGSTSSPATHLNGYSIVQAETRDDVISLVKDHPFLSLGTGEYSIEIFEVPKA